ncbi:MAG: hypothetical protein ACKVPJ_04925 [Chitinophagales bacterium]
MKYIVSILTGIVLCILAQTYISIWWIFAPVAFMLAWLMRYKTGRKSFFSGFLIVFISWMVLYVFKDAANSSLLSEKMAALFSLPNNYVLFLVSSLLMGILGGLSSLAAYYIGKK